MVLVKVSLVNVPGSVDIPTVNGTPKSSTFITELLITDTASKRCTLPGTTGYDVDCGNSNDDGKYLAAQCTVTCATGYFETTITKRVTSPNVPTFQPKIKRKLSNSTEPHW